MSSPGSPALRCAVPGDVGVAGTRDDDACDDPTQRQSSAPAEEDPDLFWFGDGDGDGDGEEAG